jgi:hypothetical protein
MNDNTPHKLSITPAPVEKQIGNTIFIVTASFNGDTAHDIAASIVRLIALDGGTRLIAEPFIGNTKDD